MSVLDDKTFNGVFVSYAHEDGDFARQFQQTLQDKLGNSIYVWMDDNLLEGKEWRREIQRQLSSTALVVVILSPDSIKSPWVLYEWHFSLLVLQNEPFLVHFRRCRNKDLKRFTDYYLDDALAKNLEQAKEVWTDKESEIDKTLGKIAERLQKFSELRENYAILTDGTKEQELQRKAAYA